MSGFLAESKTDLIHNSEIILLEDLVYEEDDDHYIIVPKGFVCDGASIPRFAWSIVGHPFMNYRDAAIVHDYLYRRKIGTKSHADKVFLQAMKDIGVNPLKRKIMYIAVKLFGRGRW